MHIHQTGDGRAVKTQNKPTTVQRFIQSGTGTFIDAIVLEGDRYLVLQDDTVCCCKVVNYFPGTLKYVCEYDRFDHKLLTSNLASRIDQYVNEARDKRIDDAFPKGG